MVRAYESTGRPARARIALALLGQRVVEADFGPCEIKTFRVPRDGGLPVVEPAVRRRPL
ncbi:hypothetical protein [Streptomyces sp. PU-14G]|uniref:hypothetical protein n=1 Tax=Streptomyces sp. PU-14G TaxID=2800808 RepID=UPI0034DF42D9